MTEKDAVNATPHQRECLLVHYGLAVDIDDEWNLAAAILQALDDRSLVRDENDVLTSETTA